jgi:hypothetical protein
LLDFGRIVARKISSEPWHLTQQCCVNPEGGDFTCFANFTRNRAGRDIAMTCLEDLKQLYEEDCTYFGKYIIWLPSLILASIDVERSLEPIATSLGWDDGVIGGTSGSNDDGMSSCCGADGTDMLLLSCMAEKIDALFSMKPILDSSVIAETGCS